MNDEPARRWKRLRVAQICLLLWLILMGPLFWLVNPRLGSVPRITAALLWLALGGTAGFFVQQWACPRCGKPFNHGEFDYATPYRRKCYHCGLPRGATEF
jgi:hypothetical protein